MVNLMKEIGEERVKEEYAGKVLAVMKGRFEYAERDESGIIVVQGGKQAIIEGRGGVSSDDEGLKKEIEEVMRRMEEAHTPIDLKHI